MNRFRIGNDIAIKWTITRGDEAEDLTRVIVKKVYIVCPNWETELQYRIEGDDNNVLVLLFAGKEQKYCGPYWLRLEENPGEDNMNVIESQPMFMLRPVTDGAAIMPVAVTELATNVMLPQNGLSAYDIAVIHGYEGTEEEWAARTEDDHTRAEEDHTRASSDHTTAASDHTQALSDKSQAAYDHTRAAYDHTTATSDHTQASNDHTRAESDHSTASADHTTATSDHTTAAADHTQAESDHATASADHTQASNDHATAASDHTNALEDRDNAITSTEVHYAEGTSATEAPTTGWQSDLPTVAAGNYLWSRITITFGDESTKVLYNRSVVPTVTLTEDQVTHLVTLAVGGSAFPTKLVSETKLTELAAQVEETYAKKTGYYESMTVGRAENLVDTKGNGTPQTFVRRTSAGTDSIEDDGTALIKKIKGNTIVWNQLYKKFNAQSVSYNGGTVAANGDGSFTINGTFTENTSVYVPIRDGGFKTVAGHKYLIIAYGIDDHFTIRRTNATNLSSIGEIITADISGNPYLAIAAKVNNEYPFTVDNNTFYPMLFDLTLLFGAGNEPSTLEEFKALFHNDYYEYNAGKLVSFNATAIKTVGFNQFNVTTGKANLLGVHQYQITGTYTALDIDGTAVTPDASGLFTPSKDGVLTVTGGDSTTCVHLTWSGYRNGEYEAYWEQAKEIPTLTGGLKSVGSIHDEITSTQNNQRIGVRAYQSGDEEDTSVLTDKTNTQYVLAEPIVTDYDEPLNLNYKVADFGTEEIIPEGVGEDGVPLTSPFVGDIIYSTDFTRELVNLPKNYQSQDSMDAALTALGTELGFTWSKTWDATNGKWTYVVTANTPEA